MFVNYCYLMKCRHVFFVFFPSCLNASLRDYVISTAYIVVIQCTCENKQEN